MIRSAVFYTIHACDGRTDGRTDERTDGRTELAWHIRGTAYADVARKKIS